MLIVKKDIKDTQTKTILQVNENLMMLYYRIGKVLDENSKYGNSFIRILSLEIKLEFLDIEGFSERNMKRMKRFYKEYKEFKKVPQLVAQIPWGHNILLFEKIKDKKIREIYMNAIIKNGWSRSALEIQIETNYHLRIGNSNNFNNTLPSIDSNLVNNSFKDPYIFEFITMKGKYKEKELEHAMLERIKDFLIELGKGFSFVGNQYKVSTESEDYYIDLLFYHLELRCYVVVELKNTKFKPEYIGQLGFYVTAINETLKKETDNPTIGLLLCKNKDKITANWSLKSSNVPIGISSFELKNYFNEEVIDKLPTEDEINMHINLDN